MNLAHPAILALLIALPALGWLGVFLRRTAVAPISSTRALEGAPRTWRLTLRWLPSGLRLAALALVVGALARPCARAEDRGHAVAARSGPEGRGHLSGLRPYQLSVPVRDSSRALPLPCGAATSPP